VAKDKIGQVMTKPVRTVNPDEKVTAALVVMDKNDIGSVIVVDGKSPVGIVTERDVVRQILKRSQILEEPVKQVMSHPVITGSPSMSVQEAIDLMLKNKIGKLPVMEGNSLVGIVSDKDLMRSVLRISYERLSKLNLREWEIEAARIAAQIITLANL
jgi:CBS domain-containing protein